MSQRSIIDESHDFWTEVVLPLVQARFEAAMEVAR